MAAPAVTTGAATAISSTGATLNGTVNPESLATTWLFEYGTTTAYGTSVPAGSNTPGTGSELAQLTTTDACLGAVGVQWAVDYLNAGSWPLTLANVQTMVDWYNNEGTPHALNNPLNTSTPYGGSNDTGNVDGIQNYPDPADAVAAFPLEMNGSTVTGGDGGYPAIVTALASGNGMEGSAANSAIAAALELYSTGYNEIPASYNGGPAPGGVSPITYTQGGGAAGSGSAAVAENHALTGLAPSTTYHYRISATSSSGTTNGSDQTFTTAAAGGAGGLNSVQTGWGGMVYQATSAPVTSVTATFTVPALAGDTGALCSIWVGIGNVMQTGIYSAYNTGSAGNNDPYPAWTWFIQGTGASQFWDSAVYPIAAGDSLTLTLAIAGNYWVATQANHTKGWSYANSTPVQAVGVVTSEWGYPFSTAEIIIEKEGTANLPDYGTLTFTGIATVPAIVTDDIGYITTVNTNTDQTPGTYSGGSFTMTWNAYS